MNLRTAGRWGGILTLIALVITFVKSLIGFVGFLTMAIKMLIAVAFIGVFALVGYLALKSWQERRRDIR